MTYIDGFVLVIKKGRMADYKKMASQAGRIWKKHGALAYVEAVGEDLEPNTGEDMGGMKALTFPKMTKRKPGEKVFFSYIVYKNKAHRNQVNAKVMKDPFMNPEKQKDKWKNMPFDMKKMAYGGFSAVVDL